MADPADAATSCAGGASRTAESGGGASADAPPLRQAAAVIVVRPAARVSAGFEVLLVRRRHTMAFMANSFVFPGGAVDRSDADACAAAVRELREEAGLALPAVALRPWSHWITPSFESKRFSAHFFLAVAPADQEVVIDGNEITEAQWLTPADALLQRAELRLPPPQQLTCHRLSQLASLAALAHSPTNLTPILPRLGQFDEGPAILLPWDADYDLRGQGLAQPWSPTDIAAARAAALPSRFCQTADGYFSMRE
ncbi:MAG: NUDIX hydrolase [Myxococcales bacterium]|nr:NUDIX hydrolase [Myxococcales bacterium]